MKKFTQLALLAIVGSCLSFSARASFQTVTLLGLNQDVIVNGLGSSASTVTAPLDAGTYNLVAADWMLNGASTPLTYGLNATGLYSSTIVPGLTYQFDNYSSSNALKLTAASPSGTLSFLMPTNAAQIYVLATSGSQVSSVTYTVTFTDNTTQVFSNQSVPDWFATTTGDITGIGRINTANDVPENGAGGPKLFTTTLSLSAANWNKSIASITATRATSSTGTPSIFAISVNTPCFGAPTAGTTTANVATACASTSIGLSLTGATTDAGINYQWQSKASGATTWTTIAAATNQTYTTTGQTSATQYRAYITCTVSTLSDTSAPVTVAQSVFTSCFCTPSGTCTNEWITGVSVGTLANTGTTCSTGGYADYTANTALTTTLNQNSSYTFNLGIHVNSANSQAGVWIDFNHSGTFDASEFTLLGTSPTTGSTNLTTTFTAPLTIPATAVLGVTRMRVRSNNGTLAATQACTTGYSGEAEDYTITIAASTNCTGLPSAGGAVASASTVCPATSFVLTDTGFTTGVSGLSFQWQSKPTAGGTFANITGATTSAYTVSSQSVGSDYRVVVKCTITGDSSFSTTRSVAMTSFMNCYCTPTYANGGTSDNVVQVVLSTLNHSTTGNTSPYYHDYSSLQPATLLVPNLVIGDTGHLVLTFGGDGNQYSRAWIDFNHNGIFDTTESFTTNTNAGGGGTVTINMPVPLSALSGQTKIRIRGGDDSQPSNTQPCGASNSTWGEGKDYLVNLVATTACNGTPNAGVALSSTTLACANGSFTLVDTGYSISSTGLSFQWQKRTVAAPTFTNIAGATAFSYTVNGQTDSTTYRLIVKCIATNDSAISTTVNVGENSFINCYCNANSSYGASGGYYGSINNVTLDSINNNSSNPSSSPYYTLYAPAATTTSTLFTGFPYTLSVTSGYYDQVRAWIDWNHNGTFDATESFYLGTNSSGSNWTGTSSFLVPTTATPGLTKMRVRSEYYGNTLAATDACTNTGYGETEDYFINVAVPPGCTGTPTPGATLSSVDSICPGINFNLSVSTPPTTSGVTFTWQSSPNGTTWTAIAGATNSIYTASQTATAYYRLVETCTASSQTATSTPKLVTLKNWYNCYCTATSNNGTSGGFYGVITNVALDSINNTSTYPTSSPYYTYYAPTAGTTSTLFTGFPYTISATSYNYDQVRAWIDWNHSGSFDSTESYYIGTNSNYITWTGSASILVPTTALPGLTKMRVRSEYYGYTLGATDACTTTTYGETEDYTINVVVPTGCTGTPAPGATLSSVDSTCPGITFNLSVTTPPATSGVAFAWQSSSNGTTWTAIAGATNSLYSPSQTANTYYRLMETCTASNQTATSTAKLVTMRNWVNCYCTPTYSNGGSGDNVINVTLKTLVHATTGNTSPYYHDYSTLQPGTLAIPNLLRNDTTRLILTFGTDGSQYSRAWIDFDHSGSFDATESFTLGTNAGGSGTATIPMFVPLTALTGQTKIRIRGGDDSQPTAAQACGAAVSTYGEAKDYFVNIVTNLLPIKLESVSARNAGKVNIVNWATSYETKGIIYNIERSADGQDFSIVGTVRGKDMQGTYQYTDNAPLNGMNYYRLNILDVDGSTEKSETVKAFVKADGSFIVEAFPNPTSSVVNVKIYGGEATGTLQLADVTGKLLRTITITDGTAQMNVADMPIGVYILKYTDNTHNTNLKLNKQ